MSDEPLDDAGELSALAEWVAYRADPTGANLAALLKATSTRQRPLLLGEMEMAFHTSANWRIAQHLTLLHLDAFAPYVGRTDEVRAAYFARRACSLSGDDSRARLALARVNWRRSLALAVLYDVEIGQKHIDGVVADVGSERAGTVRGELCLLEGMARAYLRDVPAAFAALQAAEKLGRLTVEGLVRLLFAAEPGAPDAGEWATIRLAPYVSQLGPRPTALVRQVVRRDLLKLLTRRVGST